MLYVLLRKGIAVGVTGKHPKNADLVPTPDPDAEPTDLFYDAEANVMFDAYESRGDWESFARVQLIAQQLTVNLGMDISKPKREFLPVDNGGGHYPRYDIVEIPRVGDEVSYYFNGDSYPCGKIERITPNLMIITDSGKRFNRYKLTGGWRMTGGTWWLRQGHHYEQNPSY